jgi:hypothetical protein
MRQRDFASGVEILSRIGVFVIKIAKIIINFISFGNLQVLGVLREQATSVGNVE